MDVLKEIELESKYRDALERNKKELKSVSKAIDETAKEFDVTNKTIIDCMNYEDYVAFLIEEKVIPDIDRYDFIEKNFNKEYLNSVGDAWLK